MTIKRFLVGLAALFILGIAALFIVIPVLSQSPALPPGEYDLEVGQYVLNEPDGDVLSLDLAAPVPTDTPIVPTDTPIPPTDTPVPVGHDPNEWHPLTQELGHEHGDDPSVLDHIFGPVGIYSNGQSISYDWQTWSGLDVGLPFPGNGVENELKHEGYKWHAHENLGCLVTHAEDNCIDAFRIQYHALGGVAGAITTTHSSWVELKVCSPDLQDCGIVRLGSHPNYGILGIKNGPEDEHHSVHVPLPGDPPWDTNPVEKPYRHHHHPDSTTGIGIPLRGYVWNFIESPVNSVVEYAFSVEDDWGGIDPDDPFTENFVCPDFQCEQNHSQRILWLIETNWADVIQFDDGSGYANFNGFLDRAGNVDPSCTESGPYCHPLILENVPTNNRASFKFDGWANLMRTDPRFEFDTSPLGEFWIRHPN